MQGKEMNMGEMGMQSMVASLEHIANGTTVGLTILDSINNVLEEVNATLTNTFASFSQQFHNLYSKSNVSDYLSSMSITLESIRDAVRSIETSTVGSKIKDNINVKDLVNILGNSFASVATRGMYTGQSKETTNTEINYGDALLRDEVRLNRTEITTSNNWLKTISYQLTDILKNIGKSKSDEDSIDNPVTNPYNLNGLLDGVKKLKDDLTPDFVKNFRSFINTLRRFLREDFTKLTFVGTILTSFSATLLLVGQNAENVSEKFNALTKSILLVSLMLINPFFLMGAAVLIGTIYGITKAIKTGAANNFAFGRLAQGIFLLVLAMIGMKYIPFESVLKTITLIAGISLVIEQFQGGDSSFSIGKDGLKSSSKGGIQGLVSFAFGITILTLAMLAMNAIPFMSILKMVSFIALLGITLRLFYPNRASKTPMLLSFATGIAILTLSMSALDEISWSGPLKLLAFIGALGLILKIFSMGAKSKAPMLTSFALGIGILVLSMYALDEISWSGPIKLLSFIAGLGLVLKLFGLGGSRAKAPGLVGFAFGLGLLVIAMYAMNELPYEAMFKTLAFIAGLGLVLKLIPKTAGITMMMISGGLLMMAASFLVVSLSPMSWEKMLMFGATILMVTAITLILGAVGSIAVLGSVFMLAISITTLITAGVFGLISIIPLDFVAVAKLMGTLTLVAFSFAVLSVIGIPATLGSVLMLPVTITALIMATTMMMINDLSFENVGAFLTAIWGLATTFAAITPLAIIAAVGAILLMPVAVASAFFAGVLFNITKLQITPDKIEKYNYGVEAILKSINKFGVIELTKASIKAALLIPLAASALMTALALRGITSLDISESKMDAFGVFVSKFVRVMTNTINENTEGLEKIEPGLKGIMGLTNVASDLVDIVTSFANMNYNVYEVKNGKLTLVGTRKITDAEIAQVGVNVGKLIQGLLAPLAIIASDDDEWDFGNGVKVKNPFAGGWFGDKNSGVNRLEKIGNAFKPLSESIANFSSNTILLDENNMSIFKKNLGLFIDTIGNIFTKTESWGKKAGKVAIENIADFMDGFEDFETEKFSSVTESMNKFLDKLADQSKWVIIGKNLKTLSNSFKEISTNINMLNLEKALVLERNLKLMTEKKSNKALEEILKRLEEMIGLLKPDGSNNQQVQQVVQTQKIEVPNNTGLSDEIKSLLVDISEKLETSNAKLGGKLKVSVIGQNSNSL